MSFDSFAEFFGMGKHGFYVWLSYGIAVTVILFNVISPLLYKKSLLIKLKLFVHREENAQ